MVATVAVAIVALALLTACGGSSPPGITVTDARVPEPASPDVAVVYLTVHNTSGEPDVLERVTTDAAAVATIHQTVRTGLIEKMVPSGPTTIAGGGTLTLATGGAHLMLSGRTRALVVGDRVHLTLVFRRAGPRSVTARVVDRLAAG